LRYIRDGDFISKTQAQTSPFVNLTNIPKSGPFTLVMNDANSTFQSGNTVHWVVLNITTNENEFEGNSLLHKITFKNSPLYGRMLPLLFPPEYGSIIVDYIGPAPPLNSGNHKYIFTLYSQQGEISTTDNVHIEISNQELLTILGLSPQNIIASAYYMSKY